VLVIERRRCQLLRRRQDERVIVLQQEVDVKAWCKVMDVGVSSRRCCSAELGAAVESAGGMDSGLRDSPQCCFCTGPCSRHDGQWNTDQCSTLYYVLM
jgi:hypothetical protein